jgi:hypothetical protein
MNNVAQNNKTKSERGRAENERAIEKKEKMRNERNAKQISGD